MKVLFFLEPSIELGNPEFRFATLRSSIIPQVISLNKAGVEVHTIISEPIADRAMREGEFSSLLSVSVIDPIEWANGENSLERSLRHQSKEYQPGEIERLGLLLRTKLDGFNPDVVIVWESAAEFLTSVFPQARIIYQMPGFFSRSPFPSLVSFSTKILEKQNKGRTPQPSDDDLTSLADMRRQTSHFIDSIAPTKPQIEELRNRYNRVVLLPLQIDGYFMIDSILKRKSQFDILIETLANTPKDIAVLVTNYWSGKTRSGVLSEQNIAYLRSRFQNFEYFESFDNIHSVSQLITPYIDGVVTISSSLGYQAAFWKKPLYLIGESHLSEFQSTEDWTKFLSQVINGVDISRDDKIISALTTQHLPSQFLAEDGTGYRAWLEEIIAKPPGAFPRWSGSSVGDSLSPLRREDEYLKQISYFNQVRAESSMQHCRELSQQILRHEYISFDVFDTLLYRPFKSPSDMFEFMSSEVQCLSSQPGLDFRSARRLAEREAFEKAIAQGHGETTIDEIYAVFSEQNNLAPHISDQIKALEMQRERDFLYPRASGFKAFQEAKSLAKKIIIISDMYLPKSFLETILKMNGYEGYEHLYVSSEAKCKKHNGKLFDHVLADLKLDPKKMLHIGDNLAADVIKAKERGIKPFHLVKASEVFASADHYKIPWVRDEERHSPSWKMLLAITGNRLHDNPYYQAEPGTLFSGDPWRLGYYGQGPMLLGYTKWLLERSIRDGVKRLYFLSRDGLIMKQAYDILRKEYAAAPESHYLLCSRRAVNLAKITDDHGVLDLLHVDFARTTIEHLLSSRFGLNANSISKKALRDHGFTLETIVTGKHIETLKPFILELLPAILSVAETERKNYKEYLKSSGLLDDGNVALVDIGYAGTMQESLYTLTGKTKEIGGYYLITFRQALMRVDNYNLPIRGYLGEFIDRHDTYHPFCRSVPLYETLFSSPTTSFIKMEMDRNGSLKPIYMQRFEAEESRETLVKRIHRGALEFISDCSAALGTHLSTLDVEPNKSLRILERFFAQPHPIDAAMFSGIVFEDAYGGAGLKTILPSNENLEDNCVWKKGAEVMKASLMASRGNLKTPANFEALVHKTGANQTPPYVMNQRRIEHRIIRWLVKKTSSAKKFNKFEHTPAKFFADSKARYVRAVGKIYMARAGRA